MSRQHACQSPKNPTVSLMLSTFIPGTGQIYNGQVGKGIGVLVGVVMALIVWIYGMVDAYRTAKNINRTLLGPQ